MKIDVKGLEQTQRQIKALATRLATKAATKALRAAGKVVAEAVKAAAPRVTGRGADSFGVVGSKRVLVRPSKRGFYMHYVDGGTKYIDARPFASAAGQSVAGAAAQEFERVLLDEVDQWSRE